MSTQINNSITTTTLPTFESMHYIYASAKSPTGYVISKKLLKTSSPVWSCPSEDQCQHWVSHQVLMHKRDEAIKAGATMKQAIEQHPPIDNTTQTCYNESNQNEETTMNINDMTLEQLAALQMQVAQRINELVQQQALQQSNDDTTQHEEVESVQPEVVAAPSVETQDSAPSNAAPEVKAKRKIKSKKATNIEAVAEKIEETLCVMTRDEARQFIKDEKLPIKANMSCESLNDAINAFKQGGIEAVPVEYLTKAGQAKTNTKKGGVVSTPKKFTLKK